MSYQQREIPEFVFDNLDRMKADARSKGYTLKEMSLQIGISPQTVIGQGTGLLRPTRYCYNKVAQILGWRLWK